MPWSVAQLAWTAIACALALAGLACVVRGLWRPNLGNIKPCPKCGYDLAAAAVANKSLLCPECGSTSPADKVVSRRPRRWLLASGGLLLLLLIEPAWRMPSVPQPDGSRNWFAIAPNWLLACVWPIPNPVEPSQTASLYLWPLPGAPNATLPLSARARIELDDRCQLHTLEQSRSSIWLTIYAARLQWLWNNTPCTSGAGEVQTLHMFSLTRVFSRPNREGDSWETSLRRLLAAQRPDAATFDESGPIRAAWTFEFDVLDTLFPNLNVSTSFGSAGHVLSSFYASSSERLGRRFLMLTTRPGLRTRITPAWNALNDFYAVAGPDNPEAPIVNHDDGSVRAYWIGDISERPVNTGRGVELLGLPTDAFISTMHDWLSDHGITDGYLQTWTLDPAGEILILRGDTRMHEHVRAFIASRRNK